MEKSPTKKGALLLHPGMQVLGPRHGGWPQVRSPWFSKFGMRARLCWGLFWRGLISPIFSASSAFGFLCQALGLFLVFLLLGEKKLIEQSTTTVVAMTAFIAALALWGAIQAIAAPFRVSKAERAKGKWAGDRFIYNERQRLLTEEWSLARNGQFIEFEVRDAAPYSLVDYRLEIDGPADRLSCLIVGEYYISPIDEMLKLWCPALYGRARLKKGRLLQLHCHSLLDTVPAIIRVYVVAWEMDPSVLLEYTDS